MDNKVKFRNIKKYNFKYDEDKSFVIVTINQLNKHDIITVFRDGKPIQEYSERIEEAGNTDVN